MNTSARLLRGRPRVELQALVPDVATGVRAAVATVIPLLLSRELGRRELAWMAIGGWLGTLADPGGARAGRALHLFAFGSVGTLIVCACEASSGSIAAGSALLVGIAFFGATLRALGASASSLGTMLALVAAIATFTRASDPLRHAAAFGAGSGLALVLSSIVWPVWTHLPVRRGAAVVFAELSAYATAIKDAIAQDGRGEADPAPDPSQREAWWTAPGRSTRRIREALQEARTVSLAVRARRPFETRIGSNLRILLAMAEAQFLVLVTLVTEIEARPPSTLQISEAWSSEMAALAETYEAIRKTLATRTWRPGPEERLDPPDHRPEDVVAELTSELRREGRAALGLAGAIDRTEMSILSAAPARETPYATSFAIDWTLWRDAFSPASPIAHHATRVAVAAAVAALVAAYFLPDHACWVTLTALVVLQSDTGATVRRAAERVTGTVMGGLVAAAITAAHPGPRLLAAIMFPLSVAAVVTRPRSYGWFTFFLTPVFVLIAVRAPGDWSAAVTRAVDTIVGGAIALGAAVLVFPRSEERLALPDALAEMVTRARHYSAVVVARIEDRAAPATETAIDEARVGAALALARAEGSFERLLADPIRRPRDTRAMGLVTNARRLVLATTALATFAARLARAPQVAAARERVRRYESLLDLAAVAPDAAPDAAPDGPTPSTRSTSAAGDAT